MRKGALITAVILTAVLPSRGVSGEMKQFRGIAFRGLENLSKYEAVEGVPLKSGEGKVFIDVKSLKKRLDSMPLVESSRVFKEKGTLVVEIREKETFLPLAVKNGRETVFLEIDESLRILARNRFLGGRRPVVYCHRRDVSGTEFSVRLQRLLQHLKVIRKSRKRLYGEMLSVTLAGEDKAVVTLRQRRTKFILAVDMSNFSRLESVAGYCDRESEYPEKVTITSNKVVLR